MYLYNLLLFYLELKEVSLLSKEFFEYAGLPFTAKKMYDRMLIPAADKFGITKTELDILLFLANNPEYDTATDIVKVRRLTKSHVSTSVDSLVKKGLLERMLKDGNTKTVHLKIMPAADCIVEEGRAAQRNFWQILLDGLTAEEKRTAAVVLGKMHANINNALN